MLKTLRAFRKVYDDIFVTTCDTEAMHPNVNADEGLAFIMAALDQFILKVKPIWPRKKFLSAIRLLLKCNMFQFEDA